jgi:hypothetical protein
VLILLTPPPPKEGRLYLNEPEEKEVGLKTFVFPMAIFNFILNLEALVGEENKEDCIRKPKTGW